MIKKYRGFTLIELIIVVAIVGILAAAAFVAINPAKRVGESNNARRWTDVTAILDAIMSYVVDNNGNFPSALTAGNTYGIGVSAGGCGNTMPWGPPANGVAYNGCGVNGATQVTAISSGITTCIDLTASLVDTYLPTIPQDPLVAPYHASFTGYYIYRSASSNRVTVGSCLPYNSTVIRVAR